MKPLHSLWSTRLPGLIRSLGSVLGIGLVGILESCASRSPAVPAQGSRSPLPEAIARPDSPTPAARESVALPKAESPAAAEHAKWLREKAVDKVRNQYEIHPDLPPSSGSLEDCSAEDLETLWIRNTVRIQYLRNRTLPPASGSLDLLSTTELQELWRRNAAVEQVQAEYRAANGAGTSRTTRRSEIRNEPLPWDAALAKVRRQYERNPELPLPRKPLESLSAADLEDLWIAHATLENVQGQFRMNPALPVPNKALHLFSTAELKSLWLRNDVRIQYLRNPKLPPPIRALELLSPSELLALQRKNVALEGSRSQLAAYRSTKGPSRR